MSLGGEAILGDLSKRERDLLQECWVWRAIQQLAYSSPYRPVEIRIDGRTECTMITTDGRTYMLPEDKDEMLKDARGKRANRAAVEAEKANSE